MVFVQKHIIRVQFFLWHFIARRCEPVRTLPSIDRAEHSAQRLHPVIAGCCFQRPRRKAFFIGIMRREDVRIGFLVLLPEIATSRIRPEPPRIDAHHVDGRFPVDDPFRQLPARAACCRHAEAMAFIKPDIRQVPRRPDDRATIRRIGNRAVINLLDADLAEGRNPRNRCLDMGGQAVQIFLKQFVFRLLVRPVDITGGCALFVRPENEPARFFAEIPR